MKQWFNKLPQAQEGMQGQPNEINNPIGDMHRQYNIQSDQLRNNILAEEKNKQAKLLLEQRQKMEQQENMNDWIANKQQSMSVDPRWTQSMNPMKQMAMLGMRRGYRYQNQGEVTDDKKTTPVVNPQYLEKTGNYDLITRGLINPFARYNRQMLRNLKRSDMTSDQINDYIDRNGIHKSVTWAPVGYGNNVRSVDPQNTELQNEALVNAVGNTTGGRFIYAKNSTLPEYNKYLENQLENVVSTVNEDGTIKEEVVQPSAIPSAAVTDPTILDQSSEQVSTQQPAQSNTGTTTTTSRNASANNAASAIQGNKGEKTSSSNNSNANDAALSSTNSGTASTYSVSNAPGVRLNGVPYGNRTFNFNSPLNTEGMFSLNPQTKYQPSSVQNNNSTTGTSNQSSQIDITSPATGNDGMFSFTPGSQTKRTASYNQNNKYKGKYISFTGYDFSTNSKSNPFKIRTSTVGGQRDANAFAKYITETGQDPSKVYFIDYGDGKPTPVMLKKGIGLNPYYFVKFKKKYQTTGSVNYEYDYSSIPEYVRQENEDYEIPYHIKNQLRNKEFDNFYNVTYPDNNGRVTQFTPMYDYDQINPSLTDDFYNWNQEALLEQNEFDRQNSQNEKYWNKIGVLAKYDRNQDIDLYVGDKKIYSNEDLRPFQDSINDYYNAYNKNYKVYGRTVYPNPRDYGYYDNNGVYHDITEYYGNKGYNY